MYRSSCPEVFLEKGVLSISAHTNGTSAWVFSSKFAAYFQSMFSEEHLWMAACAPIFFSDLIQ